jgi:ubiquinone/menaquinone biosynthesis C-methylase UbiE
MNEQPGGLVHPEIQRVWNAAFEGGKSDKQYPSLDLVRLEQWHFGGTGIGGAKKGRLLEYACGTGTNLIHLLKCGYEIEGIDSAPNAILMVQRKLETVPDLKHRANLQVIDVNATRLPYDDASFDFVNCMNVLSLLGSPERVTSLLKELKRVMKPGAKIILDINGPQADFAAKAKPLGNDVYLFGSSSVPTYCPQSAERFTEIIKPWFTIDDVGFTHHRYFKSEIQEFIVCGHKA